jgi:hypothetical protein
MREIDWIILFSSGCHLGKGLWVEDLPSSQGGTAHFTRARATIQTGDAEPRYGSGLNAISSKRGWTSIGLGECHLIIPPFLFLKVKNPAYKAGL